MSSRQRRKNYWGKDWKGLHIELRTNVTLADFYRSRLNAIEIPYGSIANAALFGCPVDRPRDKTRDRVPFSDKTLMRLCKPLSTPIDSAFKPQTVPAWAKMPRYVDWLRSIGCAPVRKRKPKAAPMFPESKPERWRNVPAFPMEEIPCYLQS